MYSFCRTCFLQISDISSAVPLNCESNKCQLIFCIPEMDLRVFPNAKLCNECIAVVNMTYKFKMKCQEVEDQINKRQRKVIEPTIDTQDISLGNSIYNVCKTCFVDIDNGFHLFERPFYKRKLMFCIPKMDLQVISDINLCNNCHIILDKIYIFKVKCLDFEKNIKEYLKLHGKIDFRALSVWCKVFIKHEVSDLDDFTIKQEEVDLPNENKIVENLKDYIANTTLISPKIEQLKPHECIQKTLKYENCKYKNCKNMKCMSIKLKNHSKVFKCSLCDYSAENKDRLKQHIRTHTNEKPFKCTLCEYSTARKSNLKQHILTHTGEKPFNCSLCQYSTANKSNLKRHLCTHTGEKPFKCSLCEYSAEDKFRLIRHSRTHTDEKPFKCALCEYSAVYKSNLVQHIFTHTDDKPFKCLLCKYSTARKSILKEHICIHTRQKPFKCSFCNYSAARAWTLKIHINTHTGEKPFKCSLCEYSATNKFRLKSHIRIHTGEKPFKCTLCKYSAVEKSKLKNHIRTHTGEKPFKCLSCEYSTANQSNLKYHIRRHSEKPSKCAI